MRQIEKGADTSISFDTADVGHSRCNRYGMSFVTNGSVYDMLDNKALFNALLARTARIHWDRQNPRRTVAAFVRFLSTSPDIVINGAGWFIKKLWQMKRDLIASRGRVHKLSFFIHNFMDACNLDPERIKRAYSWRSRKMDQSQCASTMRNAMRPYYVLSLCKGLTARGIGIRCLAFCRSIRRQSQHRLSLPRPFDAKSSRRVG